MNMRRYTLFLLVAVLTFVTGVAAAMLAGQVNPFPHRQAARRSCGRLTALPDHRSTITVYTVYRSDGTLVKSYEVDKVNELDRLGMTTNDDVPPPPPPPPVAPAAPRPPR